MSCKPDQETLPKLHSSKNYSPKWTCIIFKIRGCIFGRFVVLFIVLEMNIWVWRSLVARLNGVQEVGGSNPLTQTNAKPLIRKDWAVFSCFEKHPKNQPKMAKIFAVINT